MRPAVSFAATCGVLDAARVLGELSADIEQTTGAVPRLVVRVAGSVAVSDFRHLTDTGLVVAGETGPLIYPDRSGDVALVVDGAATNAQALRRALVQRGALIAGQSLAELLAHSIAMNDQRTLVNRLIATLQRVEGGFAILLLTTEWMLVARDARGLRPMVLGRRGSGWVVAPDAGMLRAVGASVEREVEPGEIVLLSVGDAQSLRPLARQASRPCFAAWVFGERLDLEPFGLASLDVGVALGRLVGLHYPAGADSVVSMPGAEAVAQGVAEQLRLPVLPALVRFGASLRVSGTVGGRRVLLVSPPLVEGEFCRSAIRALRSAGAVEVHVRCPSPPVMAACLYGYMVAEEPLAAHLDVARLRGWLDADSLAYPDRAAVREFTAALGYDPCDGCFSGEYPVMPLDAQVPLFGAR